METLLTEYPNSLNGLKLECGPISSCQKENLVNGFRRVDESMNPIVDLSPASSGGSDVESPDDADSSHSTLNFIREVLLEEEDLGDKNCMLQDCLAALQEAEKTWHDVLYQKDTPSSNHSVEVDRNDVDGFNFHSPGDDSSGSFKSCPIPEYQVELNGVHDPGKLDLTHVALRDTPFGSYLDVDSYNGIQEASKYLSNGPTTEVVDMERRQSVFLEPKETTYQPKSVREPGGSGYSPNELKGKKSRDREDSEYQPGGRSSKQSAVFVEEDVDKQTQLFDEVLLCQALTDNSACSPFYNPEIAEIEKLPLTNRTEGSGSSSSSGSNGKGTRRKKRGTQGDMVDLWTLLIQCAQSVAGNDHRSSHELLKQIRQHSSPYGDGTQRLAYYFANGLEARLAGTETPSYSPLIGNGASAAEILKSYQLYIQACPFKRISNIFANRAIMKRAQKTRRLHIIDFGILYGFQWPCLIQRFSNRPGGPPKIRITGIEFPQSGFKPSERVVETGRRLEKYAKRFQVEFEYHVIAQKWDTIQLEDLKIDRDEMTVVNCLYRLKNLPDELVAMSSPRDAVLKLIRRINPEIFVHGVVNGSYNAPFFVTRFREALFHFSSLFDMFDATIPREDLERELFEKEVFARDALNVVACEGYARVERPETYKQWQVRNRRAGFRQIPLDNEIFKRVKHTVRSEYHKDFIIDQDGHWMLQGWKGRVIHALSCWVPA